MDSCEWCRGVYNSRSTHFNNSSHPRNTLQVSHYVVFLSGSLALVVLVVATTELLWRDSKKNIGRCKVTTIFASLLIAFSILSFIVGVLSIGVVGLFALLSAMPIKRLTRTASDSGA